MSWFFVDDGFYDHPKLSLLSGDNLAPAVGLWTLAGAWSRKKLTGGIIPYHQVPRLGCTHEAAESLVMCGLWEPHEGGYRFHDWAQWQETPDELALMRAKARARTQKWRDQKRAKASAAKAPKKGKKGDTRVTSQQTSRSRHGDVGVTAAYRERERERVVRGEGVLERDGGVADSRFSNIDVLEDAAVRDEACGELSGAE